MLSSIVLACALSVGGSESLQVQAARHMGSLYVPDATCVGYTLSAVETAKATGQPVVRLTYVNQGKKDSFDLVEYEPSSGMDLAQGWQGIVKSRAVSVQPMDTDTIVLARRSKLDVGFVAGLVSEGTAKRIVERLILVKG